MPQLEVFDDWFSAGPEADDRWKEHEEFKGRPYIEAIRGHHAKDVFEFDKRHLDSSDAAVLVLPAGRSAHLEAGYMVGCGKPVYILWDETPKLPEIWYWVAGVYEGEGSLVNNSTVYKNGARACALTVTMSDKDIIEKLKETTGVGNIQGPYSGHRNNLIKRPVKAKDLYRWSVYKKDDILFVVKGIYENLGQRRKEQVERVLKRAHLWDQLPSSRGPYEFRWDIMTQFCTSIHTDIESLIGAIHE